MKIVNKTKFFVFTVAALFLTTALMTEVFQDDFKVVGEKDVVIERGDTIWSLIKKYNHPDVLAQGDMRECVDHFDELNGHLKSLYEGELVHVPILAVN